MRAYWFSIQFLFEMPEMQLLSAISLKLTNIDFKVYKAVPLLITRWWSRLKLSAPGKPGTAMNLDSSAVCCFVEWSSSLKCTHSWHVELRNMEQDFTFRFHQRTSPVVARDAGFSPGAQKQLRFATNVSQRVRK